VSEQEEAAAMQSLVVGEPVLHRESRALVGWLNDAEAMQALLGRSPTPNDDVNTIQKTIRACREAVMSAPVYAPEDPLVNDAFPGLQDVVQRPELHGNFGSLQWRPAMVDLTKVLSFQKIVHIDGIAERLKGAREKARLLELCIPAQQPPPPLGAFTDSDGKGFTISSQNPNLRIAAGHLADANVAQGTGFPEVKMQAVTLLVHMGTSYLQVIRYRDRCFIRDGYHRAAGLLRRGITKVPCIFIEARSFEEVGPPAGSFTFEVLYGDRPPHVADFWNNVVARTVNQVAIRKVVRVRGEEFVVPR